MKHKIIQINDLAIRRLVSMVNASNLIMSIFFVQEISLKIADRFLCRVVRSSRYFSHTNSSIVGRNDSLKNMRSTSPVVDPPVLARELLT